MKFRLEGNRIMKKTITFLTVVLLTIYAAMAQDIPPRPDPPHLVNDFSALFTQQEVSNLEQVLEDFARETSTQIVVVVVKSLGGYDVSDYAFRLGEKWGVGQKDKNNGVVIVLKPKTLNEKGEVFIATGYGIEHLIPDAVANNQIVDNEMIPRFKQNDYYGGLVAGTKVIMALTKGEYTADVYKQKVKSKSHGSPFFFLFILLVFVIIPILRGGSRGSYTAGKSLPFWIALGMLGSNRSMHSGTFGNFTSGGGGFGGGGFGGFGGGGFGGGGAGGSW